VNDDAASARLKRLQMLRNIGPKMAADLLSLGIETPEQMFHADPEALYEELRSRCGGKLDRCVLYAFRGAKHGIPWPKCMDPFVPPDSRA
jgi:nucleotidyltransferase/DNA polymerase involved in DNA repair